MPAKCGSGWNACEVWECGDRPVSERDEEEGRAASGAASAPLVNPGRFEAVRQLQSGRRAGWRRTADVLTGGVIVVGCLVLVASLGSSSGGPRTATTHAPASGGQAPELQALSGLTTLGRMGSQLGDEVKAGTEKLISILNWGYVNPDTGMIRAQCDDSVAEVMYLSLHARVRASSAPRGTGSVPLKILISFSHVATPEILLLERVATPSFEPYMGTFTDTVTVHLKSETAGASFYYTVDGSVPNDASTEYSSDKGIMLGLDPEGKEASYVIRALASLPLAWEIVLWRRLARLSCIRK